jgi:hypothetical protein
MYTNAVIIVYKPGIQAKKIHTRHSRSCSIGHTQSKANSAHILERNTESASKFYRKNCKPCQLAQKTKRVLFSRGKARKNAEISERILKEKGKMV